MGSNPTPSAKSRSFTFLVLLTGLEFQGLLLLLLSRVFSFCFMQAHCFVGKILLRMRYRSTAGKCQTA